MTQHDDEGIGLAGLDYWRLCDELSIVQAALLIVGIDPASEEAAGVESKAAHEQPHGFNASFNALANAVNAGRLAATIRHSAREYGWADAYNDAVLKDSFMMGESEEPVESTGPEDEVVSSDHSCVYKAFPDWNLSTVRVEDVRQWLRGRGVAHGFFFPSQSIGQQVGYRDPTHDRYAPKLAAAVAAWEAVANPGGISAKKAMGKWLRENAANFGLTDEDGKVFESAVEEICKVANWQIGGGAPRTPG